MQWLTRIWRALGVLFAAASIFSLLQALFRFGYVPALEAVVEFYRTFVELVFLWIRPLTEYLARLVGYEISIPREYVEAVMASGVVSVGYARALNAMELSGRLPENKYRKILTPIVTPILAFSLVGLGLLISLTTESLKGETEAELAARTLANVGMVAAALVVFAGVNSMVF
jgi:hypothetical protein